MTAREIEERLLEAMPGARVRATDLQGGDHFEVTVVSADFEGRTPVECHRMVYAALGDAMRGEIHALSIQTSTPDRADPTAADGRG